MSQLRKLTAVTFDLDGLMFNTEDLYDQVTDDLLRSRGLRFSLELKLKMMGLPGLQAVSVLCDHCSLEEPHQAILEEIHRGMLALLPCRLAPMPGLTSLLDGCARNGIPLSIATSSTRHFLETVLAISGLAGRFQFTLCAEDVARGKPFPDIYLKSAELHGVDPRSMLALEDSLTGSRSAASAGAFTVVVPGKHSAGCDFSHADLVVPSLDSPHLMELIG